MFKVVEYGKDYAETVYAVRETEEGTMFLLCHANVWWWNNASEYYPIEEE